MDAIKRLAIGLKFEPLPEGVVDIEVGPDYAYFNFENGYEPVGFDSEHRSCYGEVTREEYEEYISKNTYAEYQQKVKEALSRLGALASEISTRIEMGAKLAEEAGLDWTIETTVGEIDVNMLKHVDWQSSTMACAAYY